MKRVLRQKRFWLDFLLLLAGFTVYLVSAENAIAPTLMMLLVSLFAGFQTIRFWRQRAHLSSLKEPSLEWTKEELPWGEWDSDSDEWMEVGSELLRLRTDLEEQRSSKRERDVQWTRLVESIREAVLGVDARGMILFSNRRFRNWFAPQADRGTGSVPFLSITEVFRDPRLLRAIGEISRGDANHLRLELELPVTGSLQLRTFRVDLSQLSRGNVEEDLEGAPGERRASESRAPQESVLIVFFDVSDLKRADRFRIDFVANVSHEIRTPLTAIRGFTEALLDEVRAGRHDSLEKMGDKIQKNVDRLNSLVEDLLELSQLENARERTLCLESIRLASFVRNVASSMELERLRGEYQLVLDIPEELTLVADPKRVEQVLMNLLSNAFRYSKKGTQVFVGADRNPSGELELRVQDQGPGIETQHLPRLFERFYRVDADRSRASGGTGLGLAIVKHILLAHRGSVSVQSEVGKGTTFICRFPQDLF